MKESDFSMFGEVLEAARLDASMNQRMAAIALYESGVVNRIDCSSISRYENGHRLPGLPVFIGLCNVYGTTPDAVLKDSIAKASSADRRTSREDDLDLDNTDRDTPGENRRCMIYVPEELREAIGDLAHARGISFSKMISEMMAKELRLHLRKKRARAI